MRKCAVIGALLAAALQGGSLGAADKKYHIPPGRSVSSSWTTTDSAGFRWDIYLNYGQVNDGTNDAYDGGMQLQVGGTTMSVSSQGRLSKAGDEVEIGPWRRGSVNIYRRIYVDKKIGYCRWIDIFENTASSTQTLALRYYSNMGGSTRSTFTTSGQANLTDKDWGIVTNPSSSSRPAVAHIFATRNAKIRPKFQFRNGDDNLYYHHALKIPPNKTVALCLIEAQRRPESAARAFLKDFKVERELKKVPASLRRIIINMGGAMLTMGSLELPRHEEHDLVVRRSGNELLGTIQNAKYEIQTLYGKMTLPGERVVGLHAPAGAGDRIKLGLTDGQVMVGKLLSGPITLKLVNGNTMSLPTDKIDTAAYRVSPARPEEIAFRRPMIVLRNGQQLFFREGDADWSFHTQYGRIRLKPGDLNAVNLDTPDGGLHRAVFRNGSVLSGLLVTEDLNVALDLGPKLNIKRYLVRKFGLPTTEYSGAGLGELQLRNEDTLAGRIAAGDIKVTTSNAEQVSVRPADVASLTVPDNSTVGTILLKLQNGTTVEGMLVGKTIPFQITPGPKLDIYIGHIMQITQPKLSGSAATPATKPSPAPKAKAKTKTKRRAEPVGPVAPPPPPEPPPEDPPVAPERAAAIRAKVAKWRDAHHELEARIRERSGPRR